MSLCEQKYKKTMDCPKYKNTKYTKDGKVNGKQRYKCKECKYRYTVEIKSTAKTQDTKRRALILYLEGLGFRSIGRYLNAIHVSVYQWIKSFGESVEDIKSDDKIEVVEIDEMLTYIGQKKTIAGYGLLLIDMGKGLSTAYWATEVQKPVKNYGS